MLCGNGKTLSEGQHASRQAQSLLPGTLRSRALPRTFPRSQPEPQVPLGCGESKIRGILGNEPVASVLILKNLPFSSFLACSSVSYHKLPFQAVSH